MMTIIKIIGLAAALSVLIPLVYLLITGPVTFIMCQGYREMAGYERDNTDYCLGIEK